MAPLALESDLGRELRWLTGASVVSLLLHVGLAAGVSQLPERQPEEPEWVEMVVNEVEPAPVPEPVPEPEPEPEPERPPETVKFEPETQPQPQPQPVDPRPVPRVVPGMTVSSVATNTGGPAVRVGNSLTTPQKGEVLSPDEVAQIGYGSVSVPPKMRFKPVLEVPESVRAAGIQGRVEVLLTIDAEGKVTDVSVVQPLHPDADAACIAAVRKSRWKAGTKDGTAVITLEVPYSCKFEMNPG